MKDSSTQVLDSVLRRCAAYKTLSEVLDGEMLMNALWMLEERDQSADKMTFIGFFGVTAELMGINNHIVTTLYAKLNRNLDLAKNELPEDPMAKMLKYRGIETKKEKTKGDKDVIKQHIEQPVPKIKATAEMAVCVLLINNIAAEANYPKAESYGLFKEVLKEEIGAAKLDRDISEQVLTWGDGLKTNAFKHNYAEKDLATIVHCIYIALCESVGPVKADKIMNNALDKTSKLPVANLYSPQKFL